MVVRFSFGDMVEVLFAEYDSYGFFDLVDLIAFIELLVYNIVNNGIDIFELPQLTLQLPLQTLIGLPKFLMLAELVAVLGVV